MKRTPISLATAAAAALAVLVPAAPAAQASAVDPHTFGGSETFSFDDCGFTIDAVRTDHGQYVARTTDTVWSLEQFVLHSTSTFTNPATGRWFSIDVDTAFREAQLSVLSDTEVAVVARQAGAPYTVRDASGAVVGRDAGLLVLRAVFDVSEGEPRYLYEEVVADRGKHPGYYLDFCTLASDLIG
jgi:hypothetical protein